MILYSNLRLFNYFDRERVASLDYFCYGYLIVKEMGEINLNCSKYSDDDTLYIFEYSRDGQSLTIRIDDGVVSINLFEQIYGQFDIVFTDFNLKLYEYVCEVVIKQFCLSNWHEFLSDVKFDNFEKAVSKHYFDDFKEKQRSITYI
ncbi:hypothetical protein ACMZ6Y_07095 [Streptococcus pluranimalium]|nr:hypothetical protein [Streptococcus hyovaginalis]